MEFLDLTLPTPEANLALDEALLLDAEAGRAGEVLRFWELQEYAVVLGSAGCIAKDVDEDVCRSGGVPIVRRCSGGGTVLLGPGCLCYSLVLSFDRPGMSDVTHSYVQIMQRLGQALSTGANRVECAGTSDLAVDNRKVSGNSQRRMRAFVLHHGTILYDLDLARIGRYLRTPTRQPMYRSQRDHASFVANLPLKQDDLMSRLRTAWQAQTVRQQWPSALVEQLVADKYGRDEWSRRR
jgi:lipoate---protein ligase